jgi:hypothetical protein
MKYLSLIFLLSWWNSSKIKYNSIRNNAYPVWVELDNNLKSDSVITLKKIKQSFKKFKIDLIDESEANRLFEAEYKRISSKYQNKFGLYETAPPTDFYKQIQPVCKRVKIHVYYVKNMIDSVKIETRYYPDFANQDSSYRTFQNRMNLTNLIFLESSIDSLKKLKTFN